MGGLARFLVRPLFSVIGRDIGVIDHGHPWLGGGDNAGEGTRPQNQAS